MALHAALTHRTEYNYDRLVGLAPHTIRLRPAPQCRTPILSYSLRIEPAQHFINWQQDPFGNFLARIVVLEHTRRFSVTVDLVADLAVINPFDFFVEDSAQSWPFDYEASLAKELTPYLEPTAGGALLDAYMAKLDRTTTGTSLDFICDLNRQLSSEIKYLIRMEPGVQTPDETLKLGSGSCRDTGWLLVQILRRLGLAARFVSGYLIQLKPDVKALDGPSGAEQDFTDLHAWAEVYLPGAGWIGLDPTSGLVAGEGHIPLAATPSPSSAAPISGAHDEAEVSFDFEMSVTRIRETPRVTRPYSDEQWQAIVAAGNAVDARLKAGDVRLSMGGEPTFVAIDDMNGAEWNNAAVGPTKQRYAEDLIRRLATRFAPGGMLHYGQGKCYPGEQLPRWSYAVHWRTDGEPLWANPDLIDREQPRASGLAPERQQTASGLAPERQQTATGGWWNRIAGWYIPKVGSDPAPLDSGAFDGAAGSNEQVIASMPAKAATPPRAPDMPAQSLTASYAASGARDELIGADGAIGPHWRPVLDGLESLTHEQRLDRISRINTRVRETGIAHDVFADPSRNLQPWRLDLMPLVFPPAVWSAIEAGVVQRARLLEALLADIYGPQDTLKRGLVPPELVFSDPTYLRACQNITPPTARIQFFAVDIARGPDGNWRVVDTHVETPGPRATHSNSSRQVSSGPLAWSRRYASIPILLSMRWEPQSPRTAASAAICRDCARICLARTCGSGTSPSGGSATPR